MPASFYFYQICGSLDNKIDLLYALVACSCLAANFIRNCKHNTHIIISINDFKL